MSSISPWLGAGRAGLTGWILLGATAGKQRLALTKLVPDLIPAAI